MVQRAKRILICDDDSLFRRTLDLLLNGYGAITAVQNSAEALAVLAKQSFDLVILDVQMRTSDEGVRALPEIRASAPDAFIMMLSGRSEFEIVRQALRAGADDYLLKEFEPDEFRITIQRALGIRELAKQNRNRGAESLRESKQFRLVGKSNSIESVRKITEKFRASDANVLIQGETGTGKEIVARLLRKTESDGAPEPFVAVDSATLHAQTAESLLFGHEKGAFTGADRTKRGLFEEVDDGVIFFDEVGNMPLEIQAKLLRVIQEKEIIRLGSTRPIPLRFRVVAATNRPLEKMASEGRFLPDLLQRLNILPIGLPPLRERAEDIPELIEYFLATKSERKISVTEDALEYLKGYRWPGNVRELSAMIDYSLAIIDDSVIDSADLHPRLRETTRPLASSDETFYGRMAAVEADLLRTAYQSSEGNVSKLALQLGMDRSHLHAKLRQYGIHLSKSR